jgi:hypothetical protein
MIITYPDAITHKAIIKTFCDYLNSAVATGEFTCPRLVLSPDKELFIITETDELINPGCQEFMTLLKQRIEKAMEF